MDSHQTAQACKSYASTIKAAIDLAVETFGDREFVNLYEFDQACLNQGIGNAIPDLLPDQSELAGIYACFPKVLDNANDLYGVPSMGNLRSCDRDGDHDYDYISQALYYRAYEAMAIRYGIAL